MRAIRKHTYDESCFKRNFNQATGSTFFPAGNRVVTPRSPVKFEMRRSLCKVLPGPINLRSAP